MRQIIWAIPRYEMVETIVRNIESVRDDYMPSDTPIEAYVKLLVIHALTKFYLDGREASSVDVARLSGVPRSTVMRKLAEMTRQGLVERRGRRYALTADAFNIPKRLAGYNKRLGAVKTLANKKR